MRNVFARQLNLGIVAWPLWAILVAVLYWAWPLDLMPDALPFVGLVDDAGVTAGLAVGTARRTN